MVILVLVVTILSLVLLAINPGIGWLAALIAKPIVDTGWSPEFMVLVLSPIEIAGAAVPAILIGRMLMFPKDRPPVVPLKGIWTLYLVTVLIGAVAYLMDNDYIGATSFTLRTLSGVVAFYSIPAWFADRQRFRLLVIALLVAGLFPMLIGFYEAVTGDYWRLRYGAGGQIRITGLYHNSTNLRYYAYATLTGIVLYWAYFARKGLVVKLALAAYAAITAVVLFRVYSKAGYITVVVAALVWTLFARKIAWPALLATVVIIVNLVTGNVVVEEVNRTFERDVAAMTGEIDSGRALGGRMVFFEKWWDRYTEAGLAKQLFGGTDRAGGRMARGGGHNDYVRAIQQTGLLGLVVYVWLLALTGLAVWKAFLRRRTALNAVVLVVFAAWMVDTMGFTPSVYPGFQWFAWGLIGLGIFGVRGLDPLPAARRPAAPVAAKPDGPDPGGDGDDDDLLDDGAEPGTVR